MKTLRKFIETNPWDGEHNNPEGQLYTEDISRISQKLGVNFNIDDQYESFNLIDCRGNLKHVLDYNVNTKVQIIIQMFIDKYGLDEEF
jgi:hypothetical protein